MQTSGSLEGSGTRAGLEACCVPMEGVGKEQIPGTGMVFSVLPRSKLVNLGGREGSQGECRLGDWGSPSALKPGGE